MGLGAVGSLAALARLALLLASLSTATASAWVLAQNPFARPFVERSAAEVRVAFDRAVADVVDADWLTHHLTAATESGDIDEIDLLLRLAEARGLDVAPGPLAEAERVLDASRGGRACVACALDPEACRGLGQVASCNLPVEITPIGDLNAIRRGLGAMLAGTTVDRVDLGLSLLGLGATGAALASGGTSLPVKAGASALRVARRAGAMTPGLKAGVDDALRGAIRWEEAGRVARFAVGPEAMIDTARRDRIAAIAGDTARLARNTSRADALGLLRLADGPDDLAGLARLSEAAGEATLPGVRALGTARALRLLSRVSDILLAAIGLLALLAAQIGALLLFLLRRALRRRARLPRTARPNSSRQGSGGADAQVSRRSR